jgi:hypothetical protein
MAKASAADNPPNKIATKVEIVPVILKNSLFERSKAWPNNAKAVAAPAKAVVSENIFFMFPRSVLPKPENIPTREEVFFPIEASVLEKFIPLSFNKPNVNPSPKASSLKFIIEPANGFIIL